MPFGPSLIVPPNINQLIVADQVVNAPPLQGPALTLDNKQILNSMEVFAQSLAWLRRRFPETTATVVYLPAALSLYRLGSDTARYFYPGTVGSVPIALVQQRSDAMCDLVRTNSIEQGAGFLDARPPLRTAASTHVIHGPID